MTACLPDCSDGELAALALGGRQAAYGELVRRHQGWVHRLVRSHVGSMDEALDVTQASFVAAFAKEGLALARLSGDHPTNVDGTIDHVFVACRRGSKAPYDAIRHTTGRDEHARVSDHLLISAVLQRTV